MPVYVLGSRYRPCHQVVHESAAVAERFERMAGKHDIVVDHRRSVADFDQHVLAVVAEHDVVADTCPLCLPVQPDAPE